MSYYEIGRWLFFGHYIGTSATKIILCKQTGVVFILSWSTASVSRVHKAVLLSDWSGSVSAPFDVFSFISILLCWGRAALAANETPQTTPRFHSNERFLWKLDAVIMPLYNLCAFYVLSELKVVSGSFEYFDLCKNIRNILNRTPTHFFLIRRVGIIGLIYRLVWESLFPLLTGTSVI